MKHACTMIPGDVFFPGSSEAAGRNSLRPMESFPRPRWAGSTRPVQFGHPGGASVLAAWAHPDALPCSPCMGLGPCVQLLPPPQLLRGPHGSVSRGACAGGGWFSFQQPRGRASPSSRHVLLTAQGGQACAGRCCVFSIRNFLSCFPDTVPRSHLPLTLPRATAPVLLPSVGKGMRPRHLPGFT